MGFSYPWARYWVERGQSSAEDRGFLAVPEGEFAWAYEERPRTLAEFASIPVLVLLGEPGMGESRSLADEVARLKEIAGPSTEILCRNLNEYGAGELDRLSRDIFESHSFSRYREGAELHLLLDSLDECKLDLPNLATWLAARLRENVDATDRFRLRIGCRSGAWLSGLESKLHDQFPEDKDKPRVQVLELCPLRREDVAVAVRMHGMDAEEFLQAVAAREIDPLAARPITPEMLIALWRKGDLPQSKVELYQRGLETLCDEHDPDRRDAGAVGTLTARQRPCIAGRIAAAIIFCNRSAMWTGPGPPASDADFPESDLMGTDIAGGDGFAVSHPAVNETLAIAGLFSQRGAERVAFAHQSYAGFLAARYIAAPDLTPERTLRLLRHPESSSTAADLPAISLVIEVKGAWNVDLNDMKAQLRDEYLDGQSRRHGIFLLGWFGSDHAKPKTLTRDEPSAMLDREADALSTREKIVRGLVVDLTHRAIDRSAPTRSRARKSKV